MRAFLLNLVRPRNLNGRWVYLLWLVAYSVLAFIAIAHAASLGDDYFSAFVFFLVPAFICYIQFRVPTVIGWVFLFIPTFIWGMFVIVLVPFALMNALVSGNLNQAAICTLMVSTAATVLHGFIRYRPWKAASAREMTFLVNNT